MQTPLFLPPDLNVELLMSYYPVGQCKVELEGLHKRNTYNDIIDTEMMGDGTMHVTVGRNSIYNSLPEYMFHPIDRFDNLPKYEEKERFEEELEKQDEEIKKAYQFFAPLDVLLLKLRSDVRSTLEPLAKDGNVVLQQIIGDSLTDEQRHNRFIAQIIPFLPCCKYIRGNRTLLTLLLRKVLMEEGLTIQPRSDVRQFADDHPRYEDKLDMTLGQGFVGNTWSQPVSYYDIHYWSDDECREHFMELLDDVELLRLFVKDYFLSVEEDLVFTVSQDEPPLRLSDEVFYNYLGYNTNI